MKIIKWISLGITAAFIIMLGSIIYVTTVLNPNDYIDEITQIVETETDIDLSIGLVSWSFFPWHSTTSGKNVRVRYGYVPLPPPYSFSAGFC